MNHRLPLSIAAICLFAGSAHGAAILRITEMMTSGDTADWFEVTNYGDTAANLTNHRMDDGSFSVSTSFGLVGIISIAPRESVIFIEGNNDNPLDNVATLITGWNLAPSVQVGGYAGSTGSGVSFGASDGVTLFTDSSANGGTELTGPFSGLIRVSYVGTSSGVSFEWNYDTTGASISSATGTLSTTPSAGLNGLIGSPGAVPEPSSLLLGGLGALGLLRRRRA